MKQVALSGWGQSHDALASIATDAQHFSYAQYANAQDAMRELARAAHDADTLIGWSLGAQLIVRTVAAKMISPKKLVLIAPPFQFVASEALPLGMKPDLHAKFYENYKTNPQRTLTKAWELIVKDDSNEEQVRRLLEKQDKQQVLAQNWQHWLDELEDFSCIELDFSDFPETLLLHGDKDVVIGIEQSRHFAHVIAGAKLIEFPGCGHAPHWHNTSTVIGLIREHANV